VAVPIFFHERKVTGAVYLVVLDNYAVLQAHDYWLTAGWTLSYFWLPVNEEALIE
jgi:hypothetical protein